MLSLEDCSINVSKVLITYEINKEHVDIMSSFKDLLKYQSVKNVILQQRNNRTQHCLYPQQSDK